MQTSMNIIALGFARLSVLRMLLWMHLEELARWSQYYSSVLYWRLDLTVGQTGKTAREGCKWYGLVRFC